MLIGKINPLLELDFLYSKQVTRLFVLSFTILLTTCVIEAAIKCCCNFQPLVFRGSKLGLLMLPTVLKEVNSLFATALVLC